MKINLSPEEKQNLELRHTAEKSKRICDRIKSVLLRSEGWSLSKIAQALRIHNDSVGRYITDYIKDNSFEYKHKGSSESLTSEQSTELIAHLENHLYEKVLEIIAYVYSAYGVTYTVSGMTDWLRRNEFSYKLPKGQPSKADAQKQKDFIEQYIQLKATTPENEPILFIDGVHPTMQSKAAHGWIRTGKEKTLPTTASRTRINIMGAIELKTMGTVIEEYKTINGEFINQFFDKIKLSYPDAPSIHIILDQAGYHRSREVAEHANKVGIKLHFLPPYSPNLNPIERLWKVMNEKVRNNHFFASAKEFRQSIKDFLQNKLPEVSEDLRSRINDNFHLFNPAK